MLLFYCFFIFNNNHGLSTVVNFQEKDVLFIPHTYAEFISNEVEGLDLSYIWNYDTVKEFEELYYVL